MGFDDRCFQDSDEDLVRQALTGVSGVTLDELRRKGWVSLRIGDAPFAEGNFPTPSGKCELYSERLQDPEPLPTYMPPREDRISNPALAVVTDRTRSGVVCAPYIWWNKLVPGGRNANSTTSEEVTDLGGGATFYDNLVDVRSAD